MNTVDPKLTVLKFNEAINRQDITGLSALMSDDHRFIDRAGNVVQGKGVMIEAWSRFFEGFPQYRNTFTRIKSEGDLVTVYGYATWKLGDAPDHVIWTARIEKDLVAEWRIDEDSENNQKKFQLK